MDIFVTLGPVFKDVALALAGAAAGSALLWTGRRISNLMAERKYSLSGTYKAEYYDLEDTSKVTRGGTIVMKQKGLDISAVHHDADSDRAWTLTGEIDKSTGHIYGYYKAKSHLDTGLGVFILEQKNKEVLQGIWAGYDSQNRDINEGGYTLTKHLPIKVRRAKKKDTLKILHLAGVTLGDGYLTEENILHSLKKDHLYVAVHDRRVIGFVLARILEKNQLAVELKNNPYRLPTDLKTANKNGTIGFLQSISTDPDYQRKGVGKRLTRRAVRGLEKSGARSIVALGWKTENIHIGPVLRAAGFKERKTFENFWYKDSMDKGYDCPVCGDPPCHCAAVLFTKT